MVSEILDNIYLFGFIKQGQKYTCAFVTWPTEIDANFLNVVELSYLLTVWR